MNSPVNGTAAATNKTINAVYSTSDNNSTLSSDDYLNLFVKELQNQDFTSPMDNSEMMSQLTSFSNMQMMQQMAKYSQSNYACSLVGKTVTATRYNVSGQSDTTSGLVEKVAIVDDEYVFYIGGKTYTLDQISAIQTQEADEGSLVDAGAYQVSGTEVTGSSATISWITPTEDTGVSDQLTYTVYYSDSGPFETVEQVQAGERFGKANLKNVNQTTITGLEGGTAYYVNVLVTDANGYQSVYKPTIVLTRS